MITVAVGSEDGDFVASVLQSHGSVNDESLGSAYAKVWVEEDNVLPLLCHVGRCCQCAVCLRLSAILS